MNFKDITNRIYNYLEQVPYKMLWISYFIAWIAFLIGGGFIGFISLLVCLAIFIAAMKFHAGKPFRTLLLLITILSAVIIGYFILRPAGPQVSINDTMNLMDAAGRLMNAMPKPK